MSFKGKHFADVEEVKQKNVETTTKKGIKVDKFRNGLATYKRRPPPKLELYSGGWASCNTGFPH